MQVLLFPINRLYMKNLSQMEIHFNKIANTIRILSVLIICITTAFLLGVSIGENGIPSLISKLIYFLLGVGLSLMVVSEVLWKIIKKFGKTEERLFYFYNSDKKTYV